MGERIQIADWGNMSNVGHVPEPKKLQVPEQVGSINISLNVLEGSVRILEDRVANFSFPQCDPSKTLTDKAILVPFAETLSDIRQRIEDLNYRIQEILKSMQI
jgi:hypothetical protein